MLATFGVARDATQFDSSIYSGSESLVKHGEGTLVLSTANLHTGGTIVEEGTLVVRNLSALGQGGVQVRAGAKLVLDGGGGRFTVPSLTLDAGGRIDVGMSQLSIRSGFSRDALLAAIDAAKGDDGMWAGTSGIGSSVVQGMVAEGINRTLGWLGWVDNGDASFTVGFAAAGDSNLDGCVDVMDLGNIFQQMDGDPAEAVTWNAGDFNHDDMVDIVDFAELFEVGLFGEGSYLPAPPPAAPGNVQATPVSTTSVMLSWTATDTPVGYEIERSADGVGDWRPVAFGAMQISGTSATIGGLQPGERAHFRLRAFAESPSWWWDDRYRSADTAAVVATAIPSAPVAVTARGVTPTQAVISWVPGPGRSTGTVVQRQQDGDSVWSQVGTPAQLQAAGDAAWVEVSTVAPNLQFVIDTGVEPGQRYTYRVQSVSDGVSSVAVSPGGSATMPTEDPPSDSDQDGDGVPDVVELIAGSNPDASDSDGDGVGDYSEIQQGSDPLVRGDRGQKPTAPANPPEWWDYRGLVVPANQVKATGVVMLPADVPLPAPILLDWRAFDPFTVNGTTFNAGRSYYDGKGLSTGRELITVSSRWFTIDLFNPEHQGRWMGDVKLEYLSIDVDADGDNDERVQRSSWEEFLETEKYGLGNLIMLDHPTKPRVTPIVVKIPPLGRNDPDICVRFDWNQSGKAGKVKLWDTLRQDAARNQDDEITPGTLYSLDKFNYVQETGVIEVYAEGIEENAGLKTLAGVERERKPEEYIRGTLVVKGQDVGSDKVKYLVANEDSFFYQLQRRQEVRNALASRGVYKSEDMPDFCLQQKSAEGAGVPGFKAIKYQDYITGEDQYVLAFGGTDDKWDWGNNFAQGSGLLPDQYDKAIKLGREFKRDGKQGHLVVTGHSLGGGLASAAALAGGFPADTFNAAWLHEETRTLIGPDANGGAISAYYVDYDILTFIQARMGDWRDDGIIRIAPAGSLQPLDSPYDVDIAVALAAIATLFVGGSFAGPAAAAGAGRGVDILVTCHNMNVVLYGLLVREGNPAVDMLGYSRSDLER